MQFKQFHYVSKSMSESLGMVSAKIINPVRKGLKLKIDSSSFPRLTVHLRDPWEFEHVKRKSQNFPQLLKWTSWILILRFFFNRYQFILASVGACLQFWLQSFCCYGSSPFTSVSWLFSLRLSWLYEMYVNVTSVYSNTSCFIQIRW